jgi:hypothetical protein
MPVPKSDAVIEGTPSADRSVYLEGVVASGETITPGAVCEVTGLNSDDVVEVAPVDEVDKTDPQVLIAQEPDAPPRTTDADTPINHEYDAGEAIQLRVYRSGDTIQNLLLAAGSDLASASDANISPGDTLGTNDDGAVKATTTAAAGFAVAEDDVDNSGAGAGETGRVYARVI